MDAPSSRRSRLGVELCASSNPSSTTRSLYNLATRPRRSRHNRFNFNSNNFFSRHRNGTSRAKCNYTARQRSRCNCTSRAKCNGNARGLQVDAERAPPTEVVSIWAAFPRLIALLGRVSAPQGGRRDIRLGHRRLTGHRGRQQPPST